MLFTLLKPIARLILWIFFRHIKVRGRDRVAMDRPLIFISNHPNVLLDVLLLGAYAPTRTLRFIGKSTLFKNPLYAWFLKHLGVIPVARTQDEGRGTTRNRDMLRLTSQSLVSGHALALFPEGLSHSAPRVGDLKPGTTRIALRTEADADGKLGIRIVPVGLMYEDPVLFRSDATLHFGEPIEVRSFLPAYQDDRTATEKTLTYLMHERLVALTRHIADPDLEDVILDLSAIYADTVATDLPESTEFTTRLQAEQGIVEAVRYFADNDPDLLQAFAARLRAHHRKLHRLRLEPSTVSPSASSYRIIRILLAVVCAPAALYGFLHNALPYYLPRLFVRPYRKSPEMIGTVKLSVGVVLFPVIYIMLTVVASLYMDALMTLFYALSLPFSGLFVLLYHERILRNWPLWQSLVLRNYRSYLTRLADERAVLIRDLDTVRTRYLDILDSASNHQVIDREDKHIQGGL